MGDADGDASTPTPEQALEAFHQTAEICRVRLPQVTPGIEVLAQELNVLAGLQRRLSLGLQARRGFDQFMKAVIAERAMLAKESDQLPAVLEPSQARLVDDYRNLSAVLPFWHKIAATDLIQRTQLAVDDPLVLKQKKALPVLHMVVFACVKPVLEEAGINVAKSASARSIACRAVAALINRFTDHKTTATAVSSEVRRQLKNKKW
jgi:hypothetical protein